MTVSTPQPQPQPTPQLQPQPKPQPHQLVETVLEEEQGQIQPTPNNTTTTSINSIASRSRQYVTPMTLRAGGALTTTGGSVVPSLSVPGISTPIDEAVKLDGPEFEQIMKERARLRREKEDSHVAELRVKVTRLEQALAAETKRRVEATRQLKQYARDELQHWEDRCRAELQQQRSLVEERLEQLEYRLNELEERWKKDRQELTTEVTKKGNDFESALEELRKEAETERKLRQVREGQFFQQIEAKGKDYEDRWDRERQERIESVAEIVHQMESNEEARMLGRNAMEVRLEEELDQLCRDFEQERIERMKEDDIISEALDKYAIQFQQSLNILNSDDLYGV